MNHAPPAALPPRDEMYRALLASDASYDGIFFAAIRTTGIFCRPACRARKPRRENTEFFPSARTAIEAGYRPCMKCRPLDGGRRPPAWVAQLLALAERHPGERVTDREIRRLDIEPARARRWFKEHYGMTFHTYQRARRLGLALSDIRRSGDATGAGFDHGYESESGFRDAFKRTFGMPPAAGAAKAAPLLARWIETPMGTMIAATRGEALVILAFADPAAPEVYPREPAAGARGRHGEAREETLRAISRRAGAPLIPGSCAVLDTVERELAAYFEGTLTRFTPRCEPAGTPFQQRVWERLARIPYGETLSYDRLARDIGSPGAQRAVGRANGDNPIAIVVPCHRVIRADGSLSGYGGGVWRKRRLLELERRVMPGGLL